jgi:thiosulfate reductase/polysulfide reductase chain A
VDRGTQVVYLDPRFTKTAAKAEWLPLRPGTDLAFHLALLNTIISEDLYNHEFVQNYTVGLDELASAVASYTPEWAAGIAEIPAETIRRVAREFAAAAPDALAHNGWRTSNFQNSFQTERAIATLNALVGNWGTAMFSSEGESSSALGAPSQPPYPRISAIRLDGVPWKYPLVPYKLGVFQEMRDAILTGEPYPAYGWFIARQNPVGSLPDRARTLQAMSKIPFIAVVDIFLNDTAWYADVVLPEASYLERYDPILPVGDKAFIRQPVIEPQGEAKSALWIYKQLGERLGLGDFFQYEDEEDYIRQQLAPLGVSLEEVKQKGYAELPVGDEESDIYHWNTPSGKIELSSEILKNAGFSACPVWEDPLAPPKGQFYLLTGKVAQHTQFATQNNQLLHKYQDEPRLWMNPKAAEACGLTDYDLVEVASEVGKINIILQVTEAIRPDCVYMTPGFGHLSKGWTTGQGVGASDSVLHVTYTDPVSGSQALTQTFVTVKKISGLQSGTLPKPLSAGE